MGSLAAAAPAFAVGSPTTMAAIAAAAAGSGTETAMQRAAVLALQAEAIHRVRRGKLMQHLGCHKRLLPPLAANAAAALATYL